MAQAPELLAAGVKVIDLAADFRMKDQAVRAVVQDPHSARADRTSRLRPAELNREDIKQARWSPIRAATRPPCSWAFTRCSRRACRRGRPDRRLQVGRVRRRPQGGNRHPVLGSSDNFKAYGVAGHRHLPETTAQLQRSRTTRWPDLHAAPGADDPRHALDPVCALTKDISNEDCKPCSKPIQGRAFRRRDALRLASGNPLHARLEHAAPGLHRPEGGNTVIVLVVQDNLVKGASGQAVQCMNLMFGLKETAGLQHIAVMP
jgi:N-acetyl-gamma-glutamyl-phosphate reductase